LKINVASPGMHFPRNIQTGFVRAPVKLTWTVLWRMGFCLFRMLVVAPKAQGWLCGCAGIVGLALSLISCAGKVQGGEGAANGTGGGGGGSPVTTSPGPTPLARLTNVQYLNTLQDLFPGITLPALTLPAENVVGGFENDAAAQNPTSELVEDYRRAALAVATTATADLTRVLPCKVSSPTDEDPCGQQFITAFGRRAFRRPLPADLTSRAVALFQANRAAYGFQQAISLMIQAFLQAPQFLYRIELGGPADAVGTSPLDSYELASRLAYLLWNTTPDEPLLAAADAGDLGTAAGIEKQARRLMTDPRAHNAVAEFHRQWLRFSKMQGMMKDHAAFPQFTAALNQAMIDSVARFVDHAFWDEGTLDALLTDNHVFVNDALAPIYGLPKPGGTALQLATADPVQRAGVMTQAGLMAGFAHQLEDSPVLRGVFVLDRLLCDAPPPPPPGVNLTPPVGDPNMPPLTTRQAFALGHEQGSCAACHQAIHGVGFGFESYDAIGAWRTIDNGQQVDHSGKIVGSQDLDGPFDGAVDLAHKMVGSAGVQSCVVSHWLTYAFGTAQLSTGIVGPLAQEFGANGRQLRELLIRIVTSDAFRFHPAIVAGP
jgi:Protein of unknown function (DUF1592)/Protein of unknown function (DUF1588)/Protein of unknown function (DUF1595)/Protein of unknown function (DUF1587)/Protein of unknown function (DUF1585)